MSEFKLMSYNIHKGKSFLTRRHVFDEIKKVIHDVDADIVFLQEVRDFHSKDFKIYQKNQLEFLADFRYQGYYGKNCEYRKGHHGNAILTRYPILETENFNLTVSKLEKRGVLYNKLQLEDTELFTFCTHLNLRKSDRNKQIFLLEKIIEEIIPSKESNILLVGDFNDFDNSIENYFMKKNYQIITNQKTFPNFLPILSPDKVFSKNIVINNSYVLRKKELLGLSDHLPIVSEMSFSQKKLILNQESKIII